MKRYSPDMDGYMERDDDGDWVPLDQVLTDHDNLVLSHRNEVNACHAEMLQLRTQIVSLQRENSRFKKEAEDCHADNRTLMESLQRVVSHCDDSEAQLMSYAYERAETQEKLTVARRLLGKCISQKSSEWADDVRRFLSGHHPYDDGSFNRVVSSGGTP